MLERYGNGQQCIAVFNADAKAVFGIGFFQACRSAKTEKVGWSGKSILLVVLLSVPINMLLGQKKHLRSRSIGPRPGRNAIAASRSRKFS